MSLDAISTNTYWWQQHIALNNKGDPAGLELNPHDLNVGASNCERHGTAGKSSICKGDDLTFLLLEHK